jgi:hypothetical protein
VADLVDEYVSGDHIKLTRSTGDEIDDVPPGERVASDVGGKSANPGSYSASQGTSAVPYSARRDAMASPQMSSTASTCYLFEITRSAMLIRWALTKDYLPYAIEEEEHDPVFARVLKQSIQSYRLGSTEGESSKAITEGDWPYVHGKIILYSFVPAGAETKAKPMSNMIKYLSSVRLSRLLKTVGLRNIFPRETTIYTRKTVREL